MVQKYLKDINKQNYKKHKSKILEIDLNSEIFVHINLAILSALPI